MLQCAVPDDVIASNNTIEVKLQSIRYEDRDHSMTLRLCRTSTLPRVKVAICMPEAKDR